MAQVTFTPTFSGGSGTLDIDINGSTLKFKDTGPDFLTIDLDMGVYNFTVSGAAPNGPGGNVELDISGDIITDTPLNYNAGIILPDPHPIQVNS